MIQDDKVFFVLNPINRDRAEVTMILENGKWKLAEFKSYEKGESGYVAVSSVETEDSDMNATTISSVCNEIEHSQSVLSMEYDTFSEAFEAAKSIDISNGNYFALNPLK